MEPWSLPSNGPFSPQRLGPAPLTAPCQNRSNFMPWRPTRLEERCQQPNRQKSLVKCRRRQKPAVGTPQATLRPAFRQTGGGTVPVPRVPKTRRPPASKKALLSQAAFTRESNEQFCPYRPTRKLDTILAVADVPKNTPQPRSVRRESADAQPCVHFTCPPDT
jgi:hypothetical protein